MARALLFPALALGGAGLASALADALSITTADGRYVAVLLGAALPLLAGYLSRPKAKYRVLFALLALPWLAVLFAPRSSLAVTWLSGGALYLGAEATFHAARTSARLAMRKVHRASLAVLVTALVALPGLGILLAFGVVVVNMQMLIAPGRLAHLSPEVAPGEVEVAFQSTDGYALRGTFAPASNGPSDAVGVVLVHGIGDGRDRWLPWAERLRAEGMHSLRFDLRAHGQSDGAVCTYGQRERHDVLAAVQWMHEQPSVGEVVIVGSSMGAGAVLAASAELDVAAIVLLAPASDYRALVAKRVRLLGPLSRPILAVSREVAQAMGQVPMTRWNPRAEMSQETPMLVLHGMEDHTIPLALSRRLVQEHRNVRLIELPGVAHNGTPDAVVDDETAWEAVHGFLSR